MNWPTRVLCVIRSTRPLGYVAASLGLLVLLLAGAVLTFEQHLAVVPAFEGAAKDLFSRWSLLATALVLGLIAFGAFFLLRSARHAEARGRENSWQRGMLLAAVFLAFATALAGAGYFLAVDLRSAFRHERSSQQAGIARVKAQQIDQWIYERTIDVQLMATALRGVPLAEIEARQDIRDVVDVLMAQLMAGNTERSGIALLASDGRYIAAVGIDRSDERLSATARDAARNRKAAIEKLHLAGTPPQPIMAFLQPFKTLDNPNGPMLVAAIAVDPASNLFNQITDWPTATPSSEILLVQRDGSDVDYVIPPRSAGRSVQPLELKLPLSTPHLATAAALMAGDGVRIGVDDRGVPVLSASREAKAAGWTVIAQTDLVEVMAPADQRILQLIALFSTTVVVAAFLMFALWRSQKRASDHYRARQEKESRDAWARYTVLAKAARDIHMMIDADGRIIDTNDSATDTYGYAPQEFHKLHIRDLRAPQAAQAFEHEWQLFANQPHALYQTWHKRKDGTVFPVEVSTTVVTIEGKIYRQGFIRDISEELRRNEECRRVAQLHRAARIADGIMLRASSEAELFVRLCSVLVDVAGKRSCNVCVRENGMLRTIASAGAVEAKTDNAASEGLAKLVSQIIASDQKTSLADNTTLALPLRDGTTIFGVLIVTSASADRTEEEAETLAALADDVSYVVTKLRAQARVQGAAPPTTVKHEP